MKQKIKGNVMKSNIVLNVAVDNPLWTEAVDFDAVKVAEEIKDLTFNYVSEVADIDFLELHKTFDVNVSLSDDEEVHRLNKEFRGMDKPTNVFLLLMLMMMNFGICWINPSVWI